MANQINRKSFAKETAEAYFAQYGSDDIAVMNNPVVEYDAENNTFGWCSSLNPPDDDIRVLELEDGYFGDLEDTTESQMAEWLETGNDDLWNSVLEIISDETE